MKRAKALLLTLFLLTGISFGQNLVIDSLKGELTIAKEDSNKVNILNYLGKKFFNNGNYDNSLIYSVNSKKLAEKIEFKNGTAKALSNIGLADL